MGKVHILSIHWGFSLGGIGKYASLIENVEKYEAIKIKTLCIVGDGWLTNKTNLGRIDAEKISIRSKMDYSWISKVYSAIKKQNPDLIMTHGFNGYFVMAIMKIRGIKNIPLVCSNHGLYHATTATRIIMGFFYDKFTNYYLKNVVDDIVCVADYTRRYLINHRVNPDKIAVIHNGIEDHNPDNTKREKLRKEWKIGTEEIVIGAASRLDPVKGVEYLIDGLALIKTELPYVKLVIVGTGTQDQILRAQVKKLGLESRVIFTGYRTDIDQCLSAFDIFALPSLAEYHSIAILEAMRAAKPIIATNVGGNIESLENGKEAIIIRSKNAQELGEAIRQLVNDQNLRLQLGENARERFRKEFTVDTMVKKTAAWLLSCAERNKRF